MNNEIYDCILESYEMGDITLEEANDLANKISNDNEGKSTNRTYINAARTMAKEYKKLKKEIKSLINSGKYEDARAAITDARYELRNIKEFISGLPKTIKDDILSYALPVLASSIIASALLTTMSKLDAIDPDYERFANFKGTGAVLGIGAGGIAAARSRMQGKDVNINKQQFDYLVNREEKMLNHMEKLLSTKIEIK